MKKIYLVRHGETNWNREGRTQGRSDSELTPRGLMQAQELAKALKTEGIQEIYCSSLKRAALTGEIISKTLKIPIYYTDELMELGFGKWEGLTLKEIKEKYPRQLDSWHQQPHMANIPDGEELRAAQQRIFHYINTLIENSKLDTLLIVSHGTIIKLYLMAFLEMNLSQFYKLKQDNCALNVIEFKERGPVLIKYNEITYRIRLEVDKNGQ